MIGKYHNFIVTPCGLFQLLFRSRLRYSYVSVLTGFYHICQRTASGPQILAAHLPTYWYSLHHSIIIPDTLDTFQPTLEGCHAILFMNWWFTPIVDFLNMYTSWQHFEIPAERGKSMLSFPISDLCVVGIICFIFQKSLSYNFHLVGFKITYFVSKNRPW